MYIVKHNQTIQILITFFLENTCFSVTWFHC